MVSQFFVSFRKLSQFMVSQGLARIRKWTFATIRQGSRNHSPRKCENHGFLQGFAMGTLLMEALDFKKLRVTRTYDRDQLPCKLTRTYGQLPCKLTRTYGLLPCKLTRTSATELPS